MKAQIPAVKFVSSLEDILGNVEQSIRTRAYERYLERGRHPGKELDDWQAACAELLLQPEVKLTETALQTAVDFVVTDQQLKDAEIEVTERAIVLIGSLDNTTWRTPRLFKLVSLHRPIDPDSLHVDYKNGVLSCVATAAQSTTLR